MENIPSVFIQVCVDIVDCWCSLTVFVCIGPAQYKCVCHSGYVKLGQICVGRYTLAHICGFI